MLCGLLGALSVTTNDALRSQVGRKGDRRSGRAGGRGRAAGEEVETVVVPSPRMPKRTIDQSGRTTDLSARTRIAGSRAAEGPVVLETTGTSCRSSGREPPVPRYGRTTVVDAPAPFTGRVGRFRRFCRLAAAAGSRLRKRVRRCTRHRERRAIPGLRLERHLASCQARLRTFTAASSGANLYAHVAKRLAPRTSSRRARTLTSASWGGLQEAAANQRSLRRRRRTATLISNAAIAAGQRRDTV